MLVQMLNNQSALVNENGLPNVSKAIVDRIEHIRDLWDKMSVYIDIKKLEHLSELMK